GNPDRPSIFAQLQESVRGLADACRAFELPVVSGNVSLYNETSERNILPTPVIGMVGLLDDLSKRCPAGFQEDGDLVFLLGETRDELAGSQYLQLLGARLKGRPPSVSLEMERRLQSALLDSIAAGVVRSAHDVSDGGLLIALAESALFGRRGLKCPNVTGAMSREAFFFGESLGRVIVSIAPRQVPDLQRLMVHHQIPIHAMGVVGGENFQVGSDVRVPLDRLTGHLALGHTRYSTTGSNRVENAQPMIVEHPELGSIAIAHNGNLTNAESLRRDLEQQGIRFKTSSDTEVIAELLAHTSGFDILAVMRRALPRLQGAYCLLLLTRDCLVGVRDPLGIRPLSLGRLGETGHIITSETCALDTVGAEFVREVEPGEAVLLGHGIPVAEQLLPSVRKATCMFEFIYFARPDSPLQGQSLYEARRNRGRELAREAPADGDIVISLPDSGTPAAVGFAEASGIPFSEGLIKSRYITRTFIQPNQRLRNVGIKLKFNPLREILQGK